MQVAEDVRQVPREASIDLRVVEQGRGDARPVELKPRRRAAGAGLVPRDVALVDDDGAPAEILADVDFVMGEEALALVHRCIPR